MFLPITFPMLFWVIYILIPGLQKVTYVQKILKCQNLKTKTETKNLTHTCIHAHIQNNLSSKNIYYHFKITIGGNGSNEIGVHKGLTSKPELLPLTIVPRTGMNETTRVKKSRSTSLSVPSFPVSHWEKEAEGSLPLVEKICRSPFILLTVATCWPQVGQPRHLPIQRPPATPLTRNKTSFPFRYWRIQVDNISIRNYCTHFC